jgi:hypothetical protein
MKNKKTKSSLVKNITKIFKEGMEVVWKFEKEKNTLKKLPFLPF